MEDKSQYAGFWRRFAAHVMDCIALTFGMSLLLLPLGWGVRLILGMLHVEPATAGTVASILIFLLGIPLYVAYFACFESSDFQATPGKLAMGLVVTNAMGGRIGIGRAIGRNCARLLSGLCWNIGYIICGFTDRRQCVHDFVASTLVVKKDAPLRLPQAYG
jgi:uncharacterized RDD family membrane protein YckC